jgi:predicted metal-binding protein
MAGCERPCAVAYHGTGKATYLFGDMDPAEDVGDLLTFAHYYAALDDGWCSSLDRPGKLRTSTLARVPSLVAAPLPTAARAS